MPFLNCRHRNTTRHAIICHLSVRCNRRMGSFVFIPHLPISMLLVAISLAGGHQVNNLQQRPASSQCLAFTTCQDTSSQSLSRPAFLWHLANNVSVQVAVPGLPKINAVFPRVTLPSLRVPGAEPIWQQCLRSVQGFSPQSLVAGAIYPLDQSLNSKETSGINSEDLLWKCCINKERLCLWGSREGKYPQQVWQWARK